LFRLWARRSSLCQSLKGSNPRAVGQCRAFFPECPPVCPPSRGSCLLAQISAVVPSYTEQSGQLGEVAVAWGRVPSPLSEPLAISGLQPPELRHGKRRALCSWISQATLRTPRRSHFQQTTSRRSSVPPLPRVGSPCAYDRCVYPNRTGHHGARRRRFPVEQCAGLSGLDRRATTHLRRDNGGVAHLLSPAHRLGGCDRQ
jgi:hypothetical protein